MRKAARALTYNGFASCKRHGNSEPVRISIVTTSFSGALEPDQPSLRDAPVVGNDGVLVLDAAQRCVAPIPCSPISSMSIRSALEGRALGETALPKPLVAVLVRNRRRRARARTARAARRCRSTMAASRARSRFSRCRPPRSVTLIVWPCGGAAHGRASSAGGRAHRASARRGRALHARPRAVGGVARSARAAQRDS